MNHTTARLSRYQWVERTYLRDTPVSGGGFFLTIFFRLFTSCAEGSGGGLLRGGVPAIGQLAGEELEEELRQVKGWLAEAIETAEEKEEAKNKAEEKKAAPPEKGAPKEKGAKPKEAAKGRSMKKFILFLSFAKLTIKNYEIKKNN